MKKQKYGLEFKREAVKLILIDGLSVKEVSDQLGVRSNILYRWKQEHLDALEAQQSEGAQSPKELAAELTSVRKELAKQKRMNEILKKRWATSAIPSDAVSFYLFMSIGAFIASVSYANVLL